MRRILVSGAATLAAASAVWACATRRAGRLRSRAKTGSVEDAELWQRIRRRRDAVFIDAVESLAAAIRVYGTDQLVLSFNGGKDATAILHLARAALAQARNCGGSARLDQLQAVYFHDDRTAFPGTRDFVEATCERYGIRLRTYENVSFREGLDDLVSRHGARAFVIGTRGSDPNGSGAQMYQPSSPGWPVFMRVNPIIEWDYGTVWRFLRGFRLSYFSLYDQGYTSLGPRDKTFRNRSLLRQDGTYLPAYRLRAFARERAGRESGETATTAPRVGLVIIGDEILTNKTRDQNTPFAIGRLRDAGCALEEVVIVGDDMAQIASHVQRLSAACDLVITSGGVGPTHDDVTVEAVAKAFGCGMVRSERLAKIVAQWASGTAGDHTNAQDKMTMMPSFAELVDIKDQNYPLLICGNVCVLPGVPRLFRSKFAAVLEYMSSASGFALPVSGSPRTTQRKILLKTNDEYTISGALSRIAQKHPSVKIGSYPHVDRVDCETVVTVEASEADAVQMVVQELLNALPKALVIGTEGGNSLLNGDE